MRANFPRRMGGQRPPPHPPGKASGLPGVRNRTLHSESGSKRRRVVAAMWIAGSAVPLLLAAAFLVGCCVLPFHGVLHQVVPLCETAADVMRGEHHGGDGDHEAQPSVPAREKQESGIRLATGVPVMWRLAAVRTESRVLVPAAPGAYRSFISLGAVRCDQDVGLHVLVETFLI